MANHYEKFREGNRLEAKKAEGGLPRSIWETYSAFANTNGGVILLGVEELPDKSLHVCGVEDPEKFIKEFWDTVNNRQKVNHNILTDHHVQAEQMNGKTIITISVPRATRFDKPVYIGDNPLRGCFRRNGEGDYHCSQDDVSAMLRDASSQNLDLTVVQDFPVSVLNADSIRRYRIRMSNFRPSHSYLALENVDFLYQLGAVRRGEDNQLHPTQAGLLMFGNEPEIVQVFPHYFLDYQEHLDASTRWTDRIHSTSGDWSGNLFDFYYRAYQGLAQSLKIPFVLDGIRRQDETPLHLGLREALANCLIHADYHGVRGIVVIREPERLSFSNPGACRVDLETAKAGGISEPRNEILMKMFNFIEVGERAGSGLFNIFRAWKKLGLKTPLLIESFSPDRMQMVLDLAGIDAVIAKLSPERGSEKASSVNKSSERSSEKVPSANKSSERSSEKTRDKIIVLLRENPRISAAVIAKKLSLSSRAIEKQLASLQARGKIIRVGADRGGYWDVREVL